MKKIDTAASKGFRIASRLIGYIGLGLSLITFVACWVFPKCFKRWIGISTDGGWPKWLVGWDRLDLDANADKLKALCIVAGAILVVAILLRIISACCKTTVEEAVAEECHKAIKSAGKELDQVEAKAEKKVCKFREYVDAKAKEIIPEDKMPYVEKTGEFLKKYSTVILTSVATIAVISVLSSARENRRRTAERRKFLRNLM